MKKVTANVKNVMENFLSTTEKVNEQIDPAVVSDEPISQQNTTSSKGKKPPRVTISFAVENLNYLQTICRVNGMSIAKYINKLVEYDRKKNETLYAETKELLNKINS